MIPFCKTQKLARLGLVLTLALSCLGLTLSAQSSLGSIKGTIGGNDTDQYLDGASISLSGTGFRTSSDRSGRFQINKIPHGDYTLIVSYFGYNSNSRTVTVSDAPLSLEIILEADDEEIFELDSFKVQAGPSSSDRAASLQRSAANRLDIVSSDKLGQLPDSTVADAVRRLPGINIEKDSQGREGRYVTIRGMNADFNSVSINGQKVVVSNFDGASRSVPMDVVSADSAGTIEVTKSVLPSQDADSIGGSINIKSRSAFDHADMKASAEIKFGDQSLADDYEGDYPHDETPYEFSASWADKLNEEETLGLALSLNQSNRPYLFRSIESGPYVRDLGDYFAGYGRLEESFDNVESKGGTARFDFRPSENLEWSVDLAYSNRETNQGSQRAQVNFDPAYLVGDLEFEGDTAVLFTSEDRSQREVRDYYEEQENLTFSTQVVQHLGDWEIDYGLGFNEGDFAGDPNKDLRAFFRTGFEDADGNYLENSFELENGDAYSPIYGDNHATLPLSAFEVFEIRRGTRIINDETLSGFFNAKKDMLWGDKPGYLKFGIKHTNTERDFDDIRRRYRTADVDWTLDSVMIGDEQIYGSVLADYGIDQALNGQAFGPMIDPNKIREAEEALIAAGLRDEGDANWYLNQNVSRDARADLINSYDLEEEVTAGFVEAQVQMEKLTVITGVRVEATDVKVHTYAGDFYETDPDSELYIRPITGESDYTDVLPHLHVRYDANDNLTYRASINQTLARPSFRQLNPSTDIDPTANDDDGIAIKGRTDIDPVISTNLDLSMDRYFDSGSRISAGVFYKDMKDNIYRLRRDVLDSDPDYFPSTAEVSEYLNAEGATVFGLEFSFDYELDTLVESLKGFSLSGNYTYTDSEVDGIQREDADGDLFLEYGETQLFGQVPHTYNLALNFARWGIDSRLAWNRSSDYLDFGGIDADKNLDDYIAERDRIDFSIRYRFLPQWTVFLEMQNITDEDSRSFEGNEATRMRYREEAGRSSWLGLRWSN
ncbi:TonB-dependent receptor [Pelagicoccus mobilis]|uniref:TonB-dependent receptor n=1 Tax=Pelagicoccus mobilis TaxID=415221 RepID=A0A934RYQ6_9BACT|nr:TonB-dependent receptor [Pelagicoccus mobilis]MBK1875973.1 TonB-dependent receptor [Pelagicoccus mobilis]